MVICAMYFSPALDTPIKPVVGLGLPRFFGVVEEEEDNEEDEIKEEGKEEDKEEDKEEEDTSCCWPVLLG